MNSFIVEFWCRTFSVLAKLSLFALVARIRPSLVSARFVDAWVLGHLLLAIVSVAAITSLPHHHPIAFALVGYGTNAPYLDSSGFNPQRYALMFDYTPSEFGRFRLQVQQSKLLPDLTDNQVFLQYVLTLGAHGAHKY